jgi:hypothetical protein
LQGTVFVGRAEDVVAVAMEVDELPDEAAVPPTKSVCVADVELPLADVSVAFARALERSVGREYDVPVLVNVMVSPLLAYVMREVTAT